ncbi:MAG: hypothetical protein WCX79_00615 [Candidatus Paceibacterota bacterium]|jgi:hypothetical protein
MTNLNYIETYDCIKNPEPCDLICMIKSMWAYADIGYFKYDKNTRELELHTGGWSGNEEIISALEKNKVFWILYWQKTERGGHYYFNIPKRKP